MLAIVDYRYQFNICKCCVGTAAGLKFEELRQACFWNTFCPSAIRSAMPSLLMMNPSTHRWHDVYGRHLLNPRCFRLLTQPGGPERAICTDRGGNVFASGTKGLRFKSQASQSEHNVANNSPPLRHFFESISVAQM